MEYAQVGKLVCAADLLENLLHILAVADAHRSENRLLDRRQQQFGAFPGRADQMVLLTLDMKKRKDADAGGHQHNTENNNATDQAVNNQVFLPPALTFLAGAFFFFLGL